MKRLTCFLLLIFIIGLISCSQITPVENDVGILEQESTLIHSDLVGKFAGQDYKINIYGTDTSGEDYYLISPVPEELKVETTQRAYIKVCTGEYGWTTSWIEYRAPNGMLLHKQVDVWACIKFKYVYYTQSEKYY